MNTELVSPPISATLSRVLQLGILVCCFGSLAANFDKKIGASLAIMGLSIGWATQVTLSSLLHGQGVTAFPHLALAATLVALWRDGAFPVVARTIAHCTIFLAATALLMAAAVPNLAFLSGESLAQKGLPFLPGLLAGPTTQPNLLGLALVLGAPFLLTLRPAIQRIAWASVGLVILWTGSRTSWIALSVIAILGFILITKRRAVLGAALLAAATGFASTVAIPLTVTAQDAFSGRGMIWLGSLRDLSGHEWGGLGPSYYLIQHDRVNILGSAAFHGHNQFVHTLTTAGWVGVSTLGIVLGTLVVVARGRVRKADDYVLPFYLASLSMCALFEVPVIFNGYDAVYRFLPIVAGVVGGGLSQRILRDSAPSGQTLRHPVGQLTARTYPLRDSGDRP
jgi:O-antigen ligase